MTALVLGVDTPIGLTVVRELGSHGVRVHGIGRSARAIGHASRWCAEFGTRPDGSLGTWLPPLIARTGATALLAISEEDLLALAVLPPEIGGCRILTPRAPQLAIVLDKSQTLARAGALGMTVPASWQPQRDDDFAARAAALTYPAILKWADPSVMVPVLATARLPFEKAEHVASALALLTALARYDRLGAWPLVQSFCPGTGLGQMFHMANGKATLAFQHRRIHEWPPSGGVSTLCESVPLTRHVEQRALSEALLATIGWEGPAMVEYRYDTASGIYWLMEINGRFWGSLPLARACGVNFAWEHYRRAILGQDTPAPSPRHRRARYMIPETRRLLRTRSPTDLANWLAGFVDPYMRYFVWDMRDPGPFFADMANIVRKLARREMPPPD